MPDLAMPYQKTLRSMPHRGMPNTLHAATTKPCHKLESPIRFAEFIEGSSHLTEAEVSTALPHLITFFTHF